MRRREFIKSLGLFGSSILIPSTMGGFGFSSFANAAINSRAVGGRAVNLDRIDYIKPEVMPQVINVFLYGGPSELAGNLTNIEDINANSQNPYDDDLLPDHVNTRVTLNHFWRGAGGEIMERMVAKGRLSVYRTIHREIDDSKAHRPSIFSNLTGVVGEEDSRPGIATNLANVLAYYNAIPEDALFPFVTFEGDSVVFNQGDSPVPLRLKPIALDKNLRNPYDRIENEALASEVNNQDQILDELAKSALNSTNPSYKHVVEAMVKRGDIQKFINTLSANLNNGTLPPDPDFEPPEDNPDAEPNLIQYNSEGFGPRMKAAINLVINNPDTLFVSVGNDGLGGWDDHNSALIDYPPRMTNLMEALETAAKHLEAVGKNNVVINVFGDFGRNVNLNNSIGWDHGNNQNLFTVSAGFTAGSSIPGREMGKIVGKTKRVGDSKQNRQFTEPTSDSYQCEPFAVAATIYKYFGIQNPDALTGGIDPIDETGTPNEWVAPS